MKKLQFILFNALLITMLLASCSIEAGVDDLLTKARKEGKAVMLEIGSVGCIPCEKMRPIMKKLSDNYKGKLEVIFVDIKVDRKTASNFGVYMIPTQVFLDKTGREFYRHIGFFPYEDIVPVLKKAGL
jgi:thioredoxin 1